MNVSLRLGRLGFMLIALNYTWLPVGGLGLWFLALFWLPPYRAGATDGTTWLLAAAVLGLYAASLLLAEAVRTGVAGIFSARWPRSVHLCPFGAAVAYPLDEISAGRAMAVALAAPLILGILGWGYWEAAQALAGPTPGVLDAGLRALAYATGGAGALGLLPGLPLAGGWLLVALLRWLDMDTERAVTWPRWIGLGICLIFLLVGGSILVGGGDWMVALSLFALAWALREGATVVDERVQTGMVLAQMPASAVMQRPVAVLRPETTLAAAFYRHTYGTARVLPVQDPAGRFLGLLPLSLADTVLQGTWPTTTVAAVMVPAAALPAVPTDTPLTRVLEMLGHNRSVDAPREDGEDAGDPNVGYLPVVDQGRLRGVIGWDQVAEYERLGAVAGVQEAAALEPQTNPTWRRFAWTTLVLTVLFGLPLLSMVGTRMLGDAAQARALAPGADTSNGIRFIRVSPARAALVRAGVLAVEVVIDSPVPVQDVTITLDAQPLTVQLNQSAGTQATARSATLMTTLGPHTLVVTAAAPGGLTGLTTWNIQVIPAVVPTGPRTAPDPATGPR